MAKIDVIVPVYNVEDYLDQCLTSLVNQTFDDLRIIVVNDGSTDGSSTIIRSYQKRYPDRILALDKENGGLASARNFGLSHSDATYIGFIDSDDYVETTMYEKLYDKMISEDADLVMCDLEYFFENGKKAPFISVGLNLAWNDDPHKAALLSPLFAWNKLYKRELFTKYKLEYPIGLWYEDIPVSTKLFVLANKIAWVPESLVHYRQRDKSIMSAAYNPHMHDIFKVLKLMLSEMKRLGFYNRYRDELEYLFIEHCLYYGAFRFLRCSGYKLLLKEGIRLVKRNFPKWEHNVYLEELSFKNYWFVRTISLSSAPFYRLYLEWKR